MNGASRSDSQASSRRFKVTIRMIGTVYPSEIHSIGHRRQTDQLLKFQPAKTEKRLHREQARNKGFRRRSRIDLG